MIILRYKIYQYYGCTSYSYSFEQSSRNIYKSYRYAKFKHEIYEIKYWSKLLSKRLRKLKWHMDDWESRSCTNHRVDQLPARKLAKQWRYRTKYIKSLQMYTHTAKKLCERLQKRIRSFERNFLKQHNGIPVRKVSPKKKSHLKETFNSTIHDLTSRLNEIIQRVSALTLPVIIEEDEHDSANW